MINTSLVGGCFSHPPDYVMALSANLEPPGLWCLLWRLAKDDVIQDIADEGCYSFGWRLLQTCSRNPPYGGSFVELSAWPSLCEAGELGSCYWMMRRFHGMARCVHLTAALLQAVYRSCLFASVEHIFHWLPLVHFNA